MKDKLKMKIAILYICTGKYDIFWDKFYTSCEEFFCTKSEKHYFIFTDSNQINDSENVTKIFQDSLGWPFNTMYRYKMFLRIKESLLNYDWIIFFNGNCQFKKFIYENEIFGYNQQYDLLGVKHPGFYDKEYERFTYEKRKLSSANVKSSSCYFAGGINGGRSQPFLQVVQQLADNIETDLQNGIVAIWHDESHWNAYLNNNYEQIKDKLNILTPDYLYPEGWKLPFEPKILLRDKSKYGGHGLLRGGSFSMLNNMKIKLRKFLNKWL